MFGLAGSALAVSNYMFMPFYTINGKVTGIAQATSSGRQVIFFRDMDPGNAVSIYTTATVDASGNYVVPASTNLDLLPLKVLGTYQVAIAKDAAGYGAGPVTFSLSGLSNDTAPAMTMAMGAGVTLIAGGGERPEQAPTIDLWFGNRLYQPALVAKGEPFVVTEQPKLKIAVKIDEPYALPGDISAYSIVVDPNTQGAKVLDLSTTAMSSKVYAAGTSPQQNQLKNMSLEYSMAEALASGKHNFVVTARSSGALGPAAVANVTATVEVMTGPVRLIGTPITFPSPFSIDKDKTVSIQYTLSKNAGIEIILSDISGRRIKNFVFDAGTEGGSAGLNKVSWDGKTDLGSLAGNGIYVGLIVAKDEGRKLGSVKVSLLD
jgi:hypothetical protein